MIFDTLKNANCYFPLNPAYQEAVQEYETKHEVDARFEGHRKYIDIQYIISGVEVMDAIEIAQATPATEYNEEKDVTFYQSGKSTARAALTADHFAIFLPHDIHRPGLSLDNTPSTVKKIVVKIKV